jgi:hypothetical protein
VYIPRGVAQQGQLAAAITGVERMLGADVVRLRYAVETNWSGEPALFFKVLLADQASRRDRLHEVTSHIEAVIEEHLDPLNTWGLVPYYNFRSQTEQAMLKEPAWA